VDMGKFMGALKVMAGKYVFGEDAPLADLSPAFQDFNGWLGGEQ